MKIKKESGSPEIGMVGVGAAGRTELFGQCDADDPGGKGKSFAGGGTGGGKVGNGAGFLHQGPADARKTVWRKAPCGYFIPNNLA